MRSNVFAAIRSGIALALFVATSARGDVVAATGARGGVVGRDPSVAADVDGIVIRGAWRASVRVGSPRAALSGDALHPGAVVVTRRGTTLTFARTDMRPDAPRFELDVSVARLRGVATSGAVDLSVRDRSANPLFMDIAGASVARALEMAAAIFNLLRMMPASPSSRCTSAEPY